MTTPWEKFFEEKLRIISQQAKNVLDVGGGAKFGKGMEKYKDWFTHVDYKTLDITPEYQPDILGDIHGLPILDEAYDAVICKAVLEHVHDPEKAVGEIYRVLKHGGLCLAYVPFLYVYHADKHYHDYYRYSKDGISYLFRGFKNLEIVPVRGFWETWLNFLPKGLNKWMAPTLGRLLDTITPQKGNQASGYNIFAIK